MPSKPFQNSSEDAAASPTRRHSALYPPKVALAIPINTFSETDGAHGQQQWPWHFESRISAYGLSSQRFHADTCPPSILTAFDDDSTPTVMTPRLVDIRRPSKPHFTDKSGQNVSEQCPVDAKPFDRSRSICHRSGDKWPHELARPRLTTCAQDLEPSHTTASGNNYSYGRRGSRLSSSQPPPALSSSSLTSSSRAPSSRPYPVSSYNHVPSAVRDQHYDRHMSRWRNEHERLQGGRHLPEVAATKELGLQNPMTELDIELLTRLRGKEYVTHLLEEQAKVRQEESMIRERMKQIEREAKQGR